MALEKRVKWLFTLVVLANLVIVLIVVLGAMEPARPKPMPNPNGYDDFVKAGKLWVKSDIYWTKMTSNELRLHVSDNEPALKFLRAGLSHECRVPDDYSKDYMKRFISAVVPIRYLGQALCAEGRLAELENHPNDAASNYLEDIQLGEHWTQGGFMACKLMGIGSEYDGRSGLRLLIDKLDAQNCRNVTETLETVDAKEEPIENALNQEKRFFRKAQTFREQLGGLINYKSLTAVKTDFTKSFQTNQFLRRQTMLDFAARAYELEKGKPPAAITDLVPDYLKAIPKDPARGTNLALRTNAP